MTLPIEVLSPPSWVYTMLILFLLKTRAGVSALFNAEAKYICFHLAVKRRDMDTVCRQTVQRFLPGSEAGVPPGSECLTRSSEHVQSQVLVDNSLTDLVLFVYFFSVCQRSSWSVGTGRGHLMPSLQDKYY